MLQVQDASSKGVQSPSVIQSLETILDTVKEELVKSPEYRAILAIDKSIKDVSHIQEAVVCLEGATAKIKERLVTVREYRAMLAVEKCIAEVSEVLGISADGVKSNVLAKTPAESAAPLEPDAETVSATQSAAPLEPEAEAEGASPIQSAPMREASEVILTEVAAIIETADVSPSDLLIGPTPAMEAAGSQTEALASDTAELLKNDQSKQAAVVELPEPFAGGEAEAFQRANVA
ncbi:MAG: hypothetical protein WBE90_12940 [Xanthobacteraceae bacterium]